MEIILKDKYVKAVVAALRDRSITIWSPSIQHSKGAQSFSLIWDAWVLKGKEFRPQNKRCAKMVLPMADGRQRCRISMLNKRTKKKTLGMIKMRIYEFIEIQPQMLIKIVREREFMSQRSHKFSLPNQIC